MIAAQAPLRETPPIEIADNDPQEALLAFVRALAKRQARLDAGFPQVAANDNQKMVKH